MIARAILIFAIAICPLHAGAAAPEPAALLQGMLEAAGGMEAFQQLGVLEFTVTSEETTSGGQQRNRVWTAYVDAATLANMRLELPGEIVIARNGDTAWATQQGVLDERPQTPKMAQATLNQRLFPLLLPFTLAMDGVRLGDVFETSFEGVPAWRVAVTFPRNFFITPSMETSWYLHVRQDDGSLIAAEFMPPEDIRQVAAEGVRYRALKHATLGSGVQVPVQLLLDGIDAYGSPNGHVRVTKLQVRVRGPFDPTLFLHPDRLAAIEGSMD